LNQYDFRIGPVLQESCVNRYESVRTRTNLYERVRICTDAYESVRTRTNLYERVRICTNGYESVRTRTNLYKRVRICTDAYESVRTRTYDELARISHQCFVMDSEDLRKSKFYVCFESRESTEVLIKSLILPGIA
jgi:hypothetical protein